MAMAFVRSVFRAISCEFGDFDEDLMMSAALRNDKVAG